ncbi:MAG: DUF4857 domain-containing protein [Dysgonamonadaceae bacterium]|jgi:hypothetical protein|nr:DUF4857 domain-containing protein [Dysgonamonadaceae bacterium]
MKNKQLLYSVIVAFLTIISLWAIPELVKTASVSPNNAPFVYYSAPERKFLIRETGRNKNKFHDDEGKTYTDKEYDTALPLLNFRQLTINGEMPDSVLGIAIDPRQLRTKQVHFRYSPIEMHTPNIGLYIMYESLPKKAKLESPGDVFQIKKNIEFIDVQTNAVNKDKSEKFQSALLKAGYTFPEQWTSGNLNIRKPYDEGYFSLDNKNKLFHVKMVNGRPFVRDTKLDSRIEPAFFSMLEVADKRFYGFLFDKAGNVYIVEEKSGKYNALQLDINHFNPHKDELMILGNMLYWTVAVKTDNGKHYYALDTETLQQQRYLHIKADDNRWNVISKWLFPVYLTFKDTDKHSEFIKPRLNFTDRNALAINLLLALTAIFIFHRESRKKTACKSLYTLIFGIAGIVALLVLEFATRTNNNKHL